VSLSLEQLKADVASGKIDTVVVGATDMQGRLQGKRIHAPFFVADTIKNGTEGGNSLLEEDEDITPFRATTFRPGIRDTPIWVSTLISTPCAISLGTMAPPL